MIRLTIPSIDEDDLEAVRRVLETGYLVQGPQVRTFEQAVADYVGAKHAVALSSCTAALHLALLALDTRPGDLVLVTAYSWPATANVIELCGAHPVFVDIRPNTFNMDPGRLEETLERLMSNSRTSKHVRAIVPVHTFGQAAEMPAILDAAARFELPVIEDAACALGATLDGKQAGTWGAMGCYSFHPRKAITTGEGGVIVTDDSDLARRLRAGRNHGQDPEAATVDFILPGFNYRLTEFQAALGSSQMTKLDRIIAARRSLAGAYDALLQNTPLDGPAVVPQGSKPVYQSYVVLLPDGNAAKRSELMCCLSDRGIQTAIGTYHMPMTSYFRARYGCRDGDFPATDEVSRRSLTLPLHERLRPEEQEVVVRELMRAVAEWAT